MSSILEIIEGKVVISMRLYAAWQPFCTHGTCPVVPTSQPALSYATTSISRWIKML